MNSKILITGSNGLLGQALVNECLIDPRIELHCCSKGENRNAVSDGYAYYNVDLTVEKEVQDMLSKVQPSCIINTAAMTNVDLCEAEKKACWTINVQALQYLIDHSKQNTQIIQVSTDFVFDGKEGPYKESDMANPLSHYAVSKRAAELLLEHSNKLNWAIARTIIVYGKGNQLSRSNIVEWAIEQLKKGEQLNIVDDQFRSPTWATDLAKGCLLINQNKAQGIFHLSGPEFFSMYEMILEIADHMKVDQSLVHAVKTGALNRPAARPPITGFDISKAKEELGYAPLKLKEVLSQVYSQ